MCKMSDSPKTRAAKSTSEAKPLARIVRLGAPRSTQTESPSPGEGPFRSVEALAVLVDELARFENAKGQVARDQETQVTKATVSGLGAMRAQGSTKSPLSLKRDDVADADAPAQGTVQSFPGRSSVRKPEPK